MGLTHCLATDATWTGTVRMTFICEMFHIGALSDTDAHAKRSSRISTGNVGTLHDISWRVLALVQRLKTIRDYPCRSVTPTEKVCPPDGADGMSSPPTEPMDPINGPRMSSNADGTYMNTMGCATNIQCNVH